MKPAATGRILIWRGGSLWIGRAGEPAAFHAHHAIQVSLPFPGGRVALRRPGESWTNYRAAIVAAHQSHAFEATGELMAQVFVEPESRPGRALQLQYRDAGIASLADVALEREIAALAAAYAARASDADLMALAQAAIATLSAESSAPASALDARIERAIELVRKRLADTLPLGEVAAAVHLSPERFRHLFVDQTGVRFRAYLLWLRLESALGAYVAGQSLTEAAHAGGFADAAHLSRTFRKMFGIAAASVFVE